MAAELRDREENAMQERTLGRQRVLGCVVALLVIFVAQLAVTVVRDSSTWDEGDHI
jgi:hypothetical protein